MATNRHVPKALVDLSVKALQDDNVYSMAPALAPMKRVSEKTDQYFVYSVDQQFRRSENIRAPRTPSRRIDLTELSTSSYLLQRHAVNIAVSAEERMTADPAVNPEIDAVQELTSELLREREQEAALTFFTSTSFGTNLTTLSSNAWSNDTTTSTPIDDSDEAINGVMKATGQVVNGLAIGKETFDVLKDHSDIIDRVKWSERGIVTEDILASVMNVETVHVGKGIQRTTDEGISATTGYIFDNKAVFFYNSPEPRLKSANMGITFAGLFGDSAPKMKRWTNEEIDSTVIELDWMYDVKMVLSLSGYMFAAVN